MCYVLIELMILLSIHYIIYVVCRTFQVLRNRIQCIVTLLCRGAKANFADVDGMTPLHLAAAQCSPTLVQVSLKIAHMRLIDITLASRRYF